MFARVKMVFLPFRAVVGIGIQKIVVRGKIGRNKNLVTICHITDTICYSTKLLQCRVELQSLVSCYNAELLQRQITRFVPKRLEFVSNGYIGF